MNLDLLHKNAELFHKEYQASNKGVECSELMKSREDFVNYYNLDFIENKMSLENYCLGKGDNGFCYRVEYGLRGLGSAKGGYSGKFIVYYSEEENCYVTGKYYPKDVNKAFNLVKQSIITIYNAAKNDRIEDVKGASFWYMINFKLYWLYNPYSDIPVFNKKHVDKIIKSYNIACDKDDFSKRKAIFDFKNKDPVFKLMDNIEFMSFLYSPLSRLNLKAKEDENESDSFDTDKKEDKALEEYRGDYSGRGASHIKSYNDTSCVYKNIDYIKLENNKRTLGLFGEYLIVNDENRKLKELGINGNVEHSSKEIGDGLGYDIVSYDKNGNLFFIEVKTTRKNIADGFYISANEYETAERLKDSYYLYRVYHINKQKGTYKVKVYTFDDLNTLFDKKATNYLFAKKE